MVKKNSDPKSKDRDTRKEMPSFVKEDHGEPKKNPWQQDKSLKGAEANMKQSTASSVQNLPPILAGDEILAALLQPKMEPVKSCNLPGVSTLNVSYGGSSAQQDGKDVKEEEEGDGTESSDGKTVQKKAHKDKVVEYDKTRGFVVTSWANFSREEEKEEGQEGQDKNGEAKSKDGNSKDGNSKDGQSKRRQKRKEQEPFTSNEEGIFVKHVASTVINPADIFRAYQKATQDRSADGTTTTTTTTETGEKPPQASVHFNSSSFSSSKLLSHSWSNVFMYRPKEQKFKIDVESGTVENQEREKREKEKRDKEKQDQAKHEKEKQEHENREQKKREHEAAKKK